MIRVIVVLALIALPVVAEAQAPVLNPTTATWTLPTQNMDGSPFTDGKESRLKSGPCPTGPFTTRLVVPMANPAPGPNTVVSVGTSAAPVVNTLATVDGPGCAVVTVADTTGQESGPSAVVPFLRNLVPPAAPSGFQLVP